MFFFFIIHTDKNKAPAWAMRDLPAEIRKLAIGAHGENRYFTVMVYCTRSVFELAGHRFGLQSCGCRATFVCAPDDKASETVSRGRAKSAPCAHRRTRIVGRSLTSSSWRTGLYMYFGADPAHESDSALRRNRTASRLLQTVSGEKQPGKAERNLATLV